MIIGTAGHIDHGKSALVTALTGRAVDRLAEEKRRGITIELNFAPLELADGTIAGIVDVPGHEDFVRTMVAGATGIDLVLLVIDLNEGPRPQTEEHLAIVEQLGIPRGIPVFTKADLVEPDWAQFVVSEAMERLRASPVVFGEPAIVSAVTGQGIAELRDRLRSGVYDRPNRVADLLRLPVDRVFSIAGVGTVVTGTLWSGAVVVGDEISLLPGGKSGRVRSIESFDQPAARGEPGSRSAIGIAGIERASAERGDVLVRSGDGWRVTESFDAVVTLLPTAKRALAARTRIRVHAGTAEILARAYPRGAIEPGQRGFARLKLERGAVVRGNDRFVIRSYSPVSTIGGGIIIDPSPPRRSSWPEELRADDLPTRLRAQIERRRDGLSLAEVPFLAGVAPAKAESIAAEAGVIRLADHLFSAPVVAAKEDRAIAVVTEHHQKAPTDRGLSLEAVRRTVGLPPQSSDALINRLAKAGRLVVADGIAALPKFKPVVLGTDEDLQALVAQLEGADLEPPSIDELSTLLGIPNLSPLIRRASDAGSIAMVERDRYYATKSLTRFVEALTEIGKAGPITPALVRERFGLSRKFMIPLLEWADRRGVTRRVGDVRVLSSSGR